MDKGEKTGAQVPHGGKSQRDCKSKRSTVADLPDEWNVDEPVNDDYDDIANCHHERCYLQRLQY